MIWIINKETLGKNFRLRRDNKHYKWNYCPPSWKSTNNRIYIDFDKDTLILLYGAPDTQGTCLKISKVPFIIQNGGNPFKNA